MKTLLLTIVLSIPVGFAQEHKHENHQANKSDHKDHKDHDHKDQVAKIKSQSEGKITILVSGMVCAFCAQGIEKNFNKQDEVKKTKVDLDTMEVEVDFKPGKSLSHKKIKKIVEDAGFSFKGLKE